MKASRLWRFALYVTRDFLGAMLLVQAIVVLFSVAVFYADSSMCMRQGRGRSIGGEREK